MMVIATLNNTMVFATLERTALQPTYYTTMDGVYLLPIQTCNTVKPHRHKQRSYHNTRIKFNDCLDSIHLLQLIGWYRPKSQLYVAGIDTNHHTRWLL